MTCHLGVRAVDRATARCATTAASRFTPRLALVRSASTAVPVLFIQAV